MSKSIVRAFRAYPQELTPDISTDQIALRRQGHFLLGMKVISDYALLESHLLSLVVRLAKADPVTAGVMFGAIRNSATQRDVVSALAKEAADGETLQLLQRALQIVELAGSARNAFAHKIWGLDPQLPDDVVLIDPERPWRISHAIEAHGGVGKISMASYEAIVAALRAKLVIWNIDELAQAEKACASATAVIAVLGQMQSETGDVRSQSLAQFETICGWYSV